MFHGTVLFMDVFDTKNPDYKIYQFLKLGKGNGDRVISFLGHVKFSKLGLDDMAKVEIQVDIKEVRENGKTFKDGFLVHMQPVANS